MKKIRFKSSLFELELETDDLESDLEVAVAALGRFTAQKSGNDESAQPDIVHDDVYRDGRSIPEQHMNSYVAKLSANTGRKILHAASLHLSFNDGKDAFTREELFSRAREAREWKGDYANQQATNVARMVKAGELIERSSGVYTVPQKHLDASRAVIDS